MKAFLNRIYETISNNKKLAIAVVAVLAVSVAAGTTYSLISPAVTLENQTDEQQTEVDLSTGSDVTGEESAAESGLTEDEQAEVDRVNGLIAELPSYEDLENQIIEYDDAGDYDAMEAYCTETTENIRIASNAYTALTETQKTYITDYDKLQDLENFAQTQPMINEIDSDTPTTVGRTGTDPATSTSDFVKLNIYDYYGAETAAAAGKININSPWSNKKYPGFQWNGGAYMTSDTFTRWRVDNIDFGNSMITDFTYGGTTSGITNGITKNYQHVGRQGGAINEIIQYPTGYWANKPTGISVGNKVMYPTLKNGYPALADGTSLNYLFTENSYASKKNSANIDGLFRKNQTTGEYWYDSRINHAQYADNKFTLYNQIITPNFILYPFGNFLPFDNITNEGTATQVSKIDHVVQGLNGKSGYMQTIINRLLEGNENAAENQLIDMLARYRNSLSESTTAAGSRYTLTVEQAIEYYFNNSPEFRNENVDFDSAEMQKLLKKMYNIDFDVKKNFMFGMDMEMNFMQPKDGMTGNDTNKDGKPDYPMEFYFAGDDDVWVYIDDILFLDLTGIHRHVGGKIDFVNGKVEYYTMKSYVNGAVSSTPYKTMTFAEILTDIGGVAKADLGNYLKKDANGQYTTFKDYSSHKFNFYYMERGTGSSVCCINFNFPLLQKNSISVEKAVTSDVASMGNPDFKFQVLKADSSGNKTNQLFIGGNTSYDIYNSDNEKIGSGKTDTNGVFTLKAGQRAEFGGIAENSGKYYVRELFDSNFAAQYGSVTVSGQATTKVENVTIGSETFTGKDSPVKSASDGASIFHFNNDIDETKLGSLKIKKTLKANNKTDRPFDFNVTLDGTAVPAGTSYKVIDANGTESAKTVSEAGIISIRPGETALIENIKAGSVFEVRETAESAGDYTVIYGGTYTGGESVTGVIRPAGQETVLVKVTNTDGTSAEIPVNKILNNPQNGATREFTFKLEQTDDVEKKTQQTLTVLINDQGQMVDAEGKVIEPVFVLPYNANTPTGTYHYKIIEVVDTEDPSMIYDASQYDVAVTVAENKEDGALCTSTSITKNGTAVEEAVFTNTQLYPLTVSKVVTGSAETDTTEFDFTITLDGIDAAGKTFTCSENDNITQITFDENRQATVSLKHGESLTINGLPAETIWTVEEDGDLSDGYVAKYAVNGAEELTEGIKASGKIQSGSTVNSVAYTNEVCYALPETGGIGTKPFYIGGFILIAAAALMLVRQHRRREG